MKKQNIVSVHLGQYGIQSGLQYWKRMLETQERSEHKAKNPYFEENQSSEYIPNALFVDSDPTVTDALKIDSFFKSKIGLKRAIYDTSGRSTGGNFFAANLTSGRDTSNKVLEQLRRMIEPMDYFQGFQFHFALHGATGSGIGLYVLQRLHVEYSKAARHCALLMPSIDYKSSTIEPYTCIFALQQMQHASLVTMLDNQSLYDYFEHNCSIAYPNYANLNELIAKTQIALNNPLMYPCAGKRVFMRDYESSLVPYSANKYCYPSYYDMQQLEPFEESKETEMTYIEEKQTHSVVTATQYAASLPYKMFATTHPSFRQLPCKLIGMQSHFAGRLMNPFQTLKSLQILKSRPQYLKFLNYVPSGIKSIMINEAEKKSVAMLHHSTNIGAVLFTTVLEPFRKLYEKRAFAYRLLGEGPDSGIFGTADNACAAIMQNYTEIEQENASEGEEEDEEIE